ncbi:MAG: adenylate/guanylate cyclase domain-containing protein [Deltaproteobacteria bacterium]|nr:adenylate/guanylate cyclase domain-containing protein [Deltaproteobacteria bacterium]
MIRRLASLFQTFAGRWVAAVTLVVAVLVLWRPAYTEFLELKFYDLKFRYRGSLAPGPEIAIVGIDDVSLQKVGRWPWSREDMARLLSKVKEAGPRVLALDVIFAEREESGAVRTLANLRREISRRGRATPELLALLDQEERRADVDRRLAQVIGQGPPTILGFFFREVGGKAGGLQADQLLGESFIRASTYNVVRQLEEIKPDSSPLLTAKGGVQLNLPEITAAAAGSGYFNMIPDDDGVVRWTPLSIRYGPDFFAPMTLVAPDHFLGKPPLSITLSRLGVQEVRMGTRQVPVDWKGRLLINYLGGPGIFPTYSAADVLEERLPPEALKDKIVMIGATAVAIYDLRVSPFHGNHPGVEIQATVMDNLVTGRFMQTPPYAQGLSVLIIVALGLILGLTLPRLSAFWSFAFTLAIAVGFTAGNYLLFTLGRQFDLFYPLLEIGAVNLGFTVHRFMLEEQERVRLRRTFEAYVAPTVVQEIMKHPDNLRLGGERRELTILFTDIRGFTTLSENLAPEELVKVLHDFFNPMSNIIIQHSGTIDKYMGDAIMALFGAPLVLPDHARLACRTALDMVATLKELGSQWAAQGRPQFRIGVGINTGVVAVGNMGSDRLFDYTAVGDNVNLASRLEGLNKYYGTNILLSQATVQSLNGDFLLRSADLVQVKGKAKPLEVFELMGEGEPAPDLARFLEAYYQGLTHYRAGNWSESAAALDAALTLRPHDVLTRRYLLLSKKCQTTPPGPDWTPVTVMSEK